LNHTGQQMRRRPTERPSIRTLFVTLWVAAVAIAACGDDESGDPGAGNPASAATDYEAALAGAPKPLAELYAEGDVLLEGGTDAFEAQLAELRGYPVVVNKWASWCGPCRFEFPFFQAQAAKRGDEIAFLGVNANDSTDAAETFLEEFPVPYPSISDPDDDVGKLFNGFYFPSTAFYDAKGELVHTRPGPYESAKDLAHDIERYLG
jgi:cytochrome c biogenesis protein CcmG, thiol:disulfide interchange protein DsbE